jgi:hypothetical protein
MVHATLVPEATPRGRAGIAGAQTRPAFPSTNPAQLRARSTASIEVGPPLKVLPSTASEAAARMNAAVNCASLLIKSTTRS